MKKMLTMLLALMMSLTMLPAMAEMYEIQNPMPDEIAALFDVPAWEEYQVMVNEFGWASWNYSEVLDAGMVVMSNGSLNVVCIIEPDKNGNLRITQRNYTMISPGTSSLPTACQPYLSDRSRSRCSIWCSSR